MQCSANEPLQNNCHLVIRKCQPISVTLTYLEVLGARERQWGHALASSTTSTMQSMASRKDAIKWRSSVVLTVQSHQKSSKAFVRWVPSLKTKVFGSSMDSVTPTPRITDVPAGLLVSIAVSPWVNPVNMSF